MPKDSSVEHWLDDEVEHYGICVSFFYGPGEDTYVEEEGRPEEGKEVIVCLLGAHSQHGYRYAHFLRICIARNESYPSVLENRSSLLGSTVSMGTQEERQRKDNLVGRIGREEILEEGDSKAKYHRSATLEQMTHCNARCPHRQPRHRWGYKEILECCLCRNIVDLYPFLLTASKSVADSDVAELKNLRKGLFANVISQGTKTDMDRCFVTPTNYPSYIDVHYLRSLIDDRANIGTPVTIGDTTQDKEAGVVTPFIIAFLGDTPIQTKCNFPHRPSICHRATS
ncbi:hypothetical protein BD769DRAFT_1383083 [Suillus cothurnatus]|nr:hypothetical protein BD769DRAFT_1383083 [Suillus cothurnatus]